MTPLQRLIYNALTESYRTWSGLSHHENTMLDEYGRISGDTDYETLANRVCERIQELEEIEWQYKELCK